MTFSNKKYQIHSKNIQNFQSPSFLHFSALSPLGFDLLTPGMGVWRFTTVSRIHLYKSLEICQLYRDDRLQKLSSQVSMKKISSNMQKTSGYIQLKIMEILFLFIFYAFGLVFVLDNISITLLYCKFYTL